MKAREVAFQAHEIEEHFIQSRVVAQTFKVKVLQPISRTDGSERFSVLYTTDSDLFFGAFASMAGELQSLGETPRVILVGIGYQNSGALELLRWRDFATHTMRAPHRGILEQVAESPLFDGIDDLNTIMETTDAREFLHFITEELMPFIGARYPTLADENNYFGYSAGALFGLYTLFTRPNTFRRYILGSPASSYKGQDFGIELAKEFIKSKQAMDAKVYVSVGELEEFKRGHEHLELVTGYYRLIQFLKQSAIPGLDLKGRVFPGETHATAWTLAFIHGLKALFDPVEQVPYWPDFLK
jgi:uncharacterized protein